MKSITLESAHIDKARPRELASFTQKAFSGNITAFDTPWTGKKQDFPVRSAKDLGISQKAFQAIKILFPYLDQVFRANGSAVSPKEQSSISNHLNGLQKLADHIFDPKLKEQLHKNLHADFEALEKSVRLTLLLHDLPETPGEISNFRQRLPKTRTNGEPTEQDRKKLENELAEFLLYQALKAAYNNQNTLDSKLDTAIKTCQEKIKATTASTIERYRIVESFLQEQKSDINAEEKNPELESDFAQLKKAYYLSESKQEANTHESRVKKLIKLLDKLDSKIHIGTVSDFTKYDFPASTQAFVTQEYKDDKDTLRELLKVDLLKPIATKLVKIFDSLKNLFCEWDVLKETYKDFNWQEVLEDYEN